MTPRVNKLRFVEWCIYEIQNTVTMQSFSKLQPIEIYLYKWAQVYRTEVLKTPQKVDFVLNLGSYFSNGQTIFIIILKETISRLQPWHDIFLNKHAK